MFEVAMSIVLVRQAEREQYSVYYISYLFKRGELLYTGLEKLTLRLTLIARGLRPYFPSHPIVVLIDIPLGCILNQPKITMRLIK